MTNGKLFDDPIHEWVLGTAKARASDNPDGEPTELKNATEFDALGQGKYKGTPICWRDLEQSWLAQLASITLLVPDANRRCMTRTPRFPPSCGAESVWS